MVVTLSSLLILLLFFNSEKGALTIEKSNVLKAFFPYMIILHHVSQMMDGIGDFRWAGPYGVGVFFFISGYGLEYKRSYGVLNFKSYVKRIKRVLFPIILPVTVYLILLSTNGTNIWKYAIEHLMSYSIVFPYTWFVITLIVLYTSYYSLSYLFPKSKKKLFFAEFVFLLFFSGLMMLNRMQGTYYITTYCFLMGAVYQHCESVIMEMQSNKYIVITAILFLFLTTIIALFVPPFKGYATLGASIWTTCFIFLFTKTNAKYTPFLNHLKNISYDVYLCQGIAFLLLTWLSVDRVWLYAIMSILLSILFGEICYYSRSYIKKTT